MMFSRSRASLSPRLPLPTPPNQQAYPDEGLNAALHNVFDFDSYETDVQETVVKVFHKHGIPVRFLSNACLRSCVILCDR